MLTCQILHNSELEFHVISLYFLKVDMLKCMKPVEISQKAMIYFLKNCCEDRLRQFRKKGNYVPF